MSSDALAELKAQWNTVLDALLEVDRIAWLAFFDARLVSLVGSTLTLAWQDSEKFGGQHDFQSVRKPEHIAKLVACIQDVTGQRLMVVEL
ncbi:MAG: hypothetical protein F2573_04185 [Actinobacteria bacterium]|uniref:Unannotated protein n=1 Tax=freshwater metagenome TaxID=449393 RepID=A0A6J7QDI1_9ZZZZ|nr:hypothetical protein [Actinomycetota bacterium]MTA22761.1 hypothetical protein [Actinomycetota bacterium]